ncbi:hypothetical protein AB0O47_40410, partial [Streptomyces noursei]
LKKRRAERAAAAEAKEAEELQLTPEQFAALASKVSLTKDDAPEGAQEEQADAEAGAAKEAALSAGLLAAVRRTVADAAHDDHKRRKLLFVLKYAAGMGIGLAVGLDGIVRSVLDRAHAAPDVALAVLAACGVAVAAWRVLGWLRPYLQPIFATIGQLFAGLTVLVSWIPLVGQLTTTAVTTYDAVFVRYLAFRFCASLGVAWFALPWGWVGADYAADAGANVVWIGTRLSGVALTAVTWWAIDRHTGRYATNWFGYCFHAVTCTITASAAFGTLAYEIR